MLKMSYLVFTVSLLVVGVQNPGFASESPVSLESVLVATGVADSWFGCSSRTGDQGPYCSGNCPESNTSGICVSRGKGNGTGCHCEYGDLSGVTPIF